MFGIFNCAETEEKPYKIQSPHGMLSLFLSLAVVLSVITVASSVVQAQEPASFGTGTSCYLDVEKGDDSNSGTEDIPITVGICRIVLEKWNTKDRLSNNETAMRRKGKLWGKILSVRRTIPLHCRQLL